MTATHQPIRSDSSDRPNTEIQIICFELGKYKGDIQSTNATCINANKNNICTSMLYFDLHARK